MKVKVHKIQQRIRVIADWWFDGLVTYKEPLVGSMRHIYSNTNTPLELKGLEYATGLSDLTKALVAEKYDTIGAQGFFFGTQEEVVQKKGWGLFVITSPHSREPMPKIGEGATLKFTIVPYSEWSFLKKKWNWGEAHFIPCEFDSGKILKNRQVMPK
jgi:hypothetical protein